MKIDGRVCHDLITQTMKQKLGYSEEVDFNTWKAQLKAKFMELTGLEDIELNGAEDPKFEIESEEQKDGYKQFRCSFESEKGACVVMYVLIPDDMKEGEKRPLVITQQGHSTGFHNSVGILKFEQDEKYQETRGKFAVQSVNEGYVTVAVENRGMGERAATSVYDENGKNIRNVARGGKPGCYYEEVTGVLLGRCLIGERCYDIKRTIDMMLEHFGDIIDQKKIVITGNSGGGTLSYYAACYDERITLSVPSSAFCPYPESILRFYHCSCNYIPMAFKWWDMQDLAGLIAPRRLALINGESDPSFKADGVRRGYKTVKKIYERVGAPDNCKSIIMSDHGHWWGVEYVWPTIREELAKL